MRALWQKSRLTSREGNRLVNPPEVLETLAQAFPDAVLDGELLGKSWGDTVSAVKRITPGRGSGVGFYVFDVLEVSGRPLVALPLIERKRELARLFCRVDSASMVWQVPFEETIGEPRDAADGYLAEGYEGAMLKLASSPYFAGRRSDCWLKVKALAETDAQAIGAEEGTGRLTGTLGAVVVQAGSRRFKVGSGFSDSERERLWRMHRQGKLTGVRLTITFQPDAKIVGRFPRFLRVRDDY